MAEARWLVYLLECVDGSLYCGITVDLGRRLAAHNAGRGGAYTRSRMPVKIKAVSPAKMTRSEALKLERRIKKLRREEKVGKLLFAPLVGDEA